VGWLAAVTLQIQGQRTYTHRHPHVSVCKYGWGKAQGPQVRSLTLITFYESHACTHTRTHTLTHTQTCTHAGTHTRAHMQANTHVHTHTHTHTSTHTIHTQGELDAKYGGGEAKAVYAAYKRVFSMLPLAALVQGTTLILHGGKRGHNSTPFAKLCIVKWWWGLLPKG